MTPVIAVTGVAREAASLRHPGILTITGGGDPVALRAKIEQAAPTAAGIISYGMTGALADGLRIGDWVIGTHLSGAVDQDCHAAWIAALHTRFPNARRGGYYADGRMIDTIDEKRALADRYDVIAVDMESHIAAAVAAERGLPFAILRCVSDKASHALPPAIIVAMRPDGGIDGMAMARSLATRPAQLPDFARTIAGFANAMRALKRGGAQIGQRMALPD